LGFVIVRVASNTLAAYLPSFEQLLRAVESVRKREVIHLDIRPSRFCYSGELLFLGLTSM